MQRLTCSLRELKCASRENDADRMTFAGYGAVFGNVDADGDLILPGAFRHSLAAAQAGHTPWPVMLLQHGGGRLEAGDLTPIGVWTNLREDEVGLRVSGTLADTTRGREVYTLMTMAPRPAIDGLSIGYVAKQWEPAATPGLPRRRLTRLDLVEISPVTFPANARARVDQVKGTVEREVIETLAALLRRNITSIKTATGR